MIDPFVMLAPVLLLAVIALLRFIGCTPFGVTPEANEPTFNPPPGPYTVAQLVGGVGLSTTTPDATIRFTTDGTDPQTSATAQTYGPWIPVSATTTIKAYVSSAPGFDPSPVVDGIYIILPPPPPPVEVTFQGPSPPGNPLTPLNGIYKNLDFGPSRWLWQGPTGISPRNSITFNTGSSNPAARQFSFANGPRVLRKMKVFVQSDNAQIRLTDGVNPPKDYTLNIADGLLDIATGWTMPAGTVTVSSSVGWNLCIDTIVYSGPP